MHLPGDVFAGQALRMMLHLCDGVVLCV